MEKYYYWLDYPSKIGEFKNYLFDLIVNHEKVVIKQRDLGEKGILYEIEVGEEIKVD